MKKKRTGARAHGLLFCFGGQIPGETTYAPTVGFMATSMDVMGWLMSLVLSTQPWRRDPNVVPLPWRTDIVQATLARVGGARAAAAAAAAAATAASADAPLPLKFGLLKWDGAVRPHPPISRALDFVADVLTKAGHKASLCFFGEAHLFPPSHPHSLAPRACPTCAPGAPLAPPPDNESRP